MIGKTINGFDIISNSAIEALRDKNEPSNIIVQKGGQENLLSTSADITIYGGCRGGGKSYGILCDVLHDAYSPHFKGLILRNEINDLLDLIDTSQKLYSPIGEYNRARNDMTWNFFKGGSLKFDYYSGYFEEFKRRFQGKQYSYIAIDEITHIEYRKFKYLLTDNRNAHNLRNRVIGSCNPDYYSWVYKFIRPWLDENGKPIKEMDGKVRYCFMDGENVEDIVWGDTKEEVYNQCRDVIDSFYTEDLRKYGNPEDLFIKSVCFIEGKLVDNVALVSSDPRYVASLANQSEYERNRDYFGLWVPQLTGDDIVSMQHMQNFFDNSIQEGDRVLRCSCDVAFSGGDNLVMWLWRGNHIEDVYAVRKIDSRKAMEMIKYRLSQWGVQEQNFTYDVTGIGQGLRGFFPKAMPFNNLETPIDCPKGTYSNLKSQCAFMFAEKLIAGEFSINEDLLNRKFSGTGYESKALKDILAQERKVIRPDVNATSSGRKIITKKDMIRAVGHSPDFIESLFMFILFTLKKKKQIKGIGLL